MIVLSLTHIFSKSNQKMKSSASNMARWGEFKMTDPTEWVRISGEERKARNPARMRWKRRCGVSVESDGDRGARTPVADEQELASVGKMARRLSRSSFESRSKNRRKKNKQTKNKGAPWNFLSEKRPDERNGSMARISFSNSNIELFGFFFVFFCRIMFSWIRWNKVLTEHVPKINIFL